MSLTFSNYKNQRDSYEFNFKFDALCESIIENNVDFFDFWQESILPVIETTQAQDENELLNEFLGMFKKKNTGEKDFLGNMNRINNSMEIEKQKRMEEEKARNQAARDKKLADFQKQVDSYIATIKNRFKIVLGKFIRQAHQEAKDTNNPVLWEILNQFYDRISKATTKYSIKSDYGPAEYRSKFQQALKPQALKPQAGNATQAPATQAPATPPATAPLTPRIDNPRVSNFGSDVYQSKENAENGNNTLVESLIRCTGSYK